nr:hypothetical protein [Sinorhizobium meliloti]
MAKSAGRAATAFHLLVGFLTIRHNFNVQQNVSGDSYHMGGHDYGGFRRRDLYERLRRVPVGHAGHIEDASQRLRWNNKGVSSGKPHLDQRISMRGSLLEFQIAAREISYNRR